MEKTVKGATKVKLAAPKSKYVEPILAATRSGEAGVADVFRTLHLRLQDSTWTIVFKSLIIVHLMIREGAPEATLKFLAESPKRMSISSFTEVQTQGVSIRRYYEYLVTRVKAYRDSKMDHVRAAGSEKLKGLSVDKGLLRQTEMVQEQIKALLKCDMLGTHDPENEISITAFRLLTLDLLELFKVLNEGTINVLEKYFEMSKPDAERALRIYETFGRQTDQVVQYLSLARQYERYTKLEVPKVKHAPTTLTSSLQDYLNDPDFEINRRQYLAQQEAKRTGKSVPRSQPTSTPFDKPAASRSTLPATARSAPVQAKGPAPDLIDFFESIEPDQPQTQNGMSQQQQYGPGYMAQQQFAQQQQQIPQQTGYNPFMQQQGFSQQMQQPQQPQPLQPDFTGAGFGGYGPQPSQQTSNYTFSSQLSSIPQDGVPNFQTQQQQQSQYQQPTAQPLQPQETNPFRQSMMVNSNNMQQAPPPQSQQNLNRQSTNPFARSQPTGTSFLVHDSTTMNNNGNHGHNIQSSQFSSPSSSSPQPSYPSSSFQQQQSQFSTTNSSSSPQPPPLTNQQQQQPQPPLQHQMTGTNPFSKNRSMSPPAQSSAPPHLNPLSVNVTGSTNPFRQSQFVSQTTGTGWQHSNQGTFAGFDMNAVGTTPIFPRPGA